MFFVCLFVCSSIPAGNYIFKVNNRNTRTRSQLCSKLANQLTGSYMIGTSVMKELNTSPFESVSIKSLFTSTFKNIILTFDKCQSLTFTNFSKMFTAMLSNWLSISPCCTLNTFLFDKKLVQGLHGPMGHIWPCYKNIFSLCNLLYSKRFWKNFSLTKKIILKNEIIL